MWPRLSILAGLLAGVAVALLVLGGVLAFAPEPGAAATPAPVPSESIPIVSPSPSEALPSPTVSGASPSAGASAGPSGSAAGLFHIGELAPALSVPQVGGGTIDLANLRGQPVWVNFMGTYCPPCLDEFPVMNGFAARYADEGLVILAIDVKEEEGRGRRLRRKPVGHVPDRARQRRLRAGPLGGPGAARPFLDRQGRDHP